MCLIERSITTLDIKYEYCTVESARGVLPPNSFCEAQMRVCTQYRECRKLEHWKYTLQIGYTHYSDK